MEPKIFTQFKAQWGSEDRCLLHSSTQHMEEIKNQVK